MSSSLKRLIVVSPESLDLKPLTGRGLGRLIHWVADWSEVISLFDESGRIGGSTGQVLIRMRISGDKAASKKPVDITRCIHPSHPITSRFDLITEATFGTDRPPPSEEQVQAFLADPSTVGSPTPTESPTRGMRLTSRH